MAARSRSSGFDKPSEAMLRNGLQALFLDEVFATKVYDHLRPNKRQELMNLAHERRLDDHESDINRIKNRWDYSDYHKEHNPERYNELTAEIAVIQGKIDELKTTHWIPRRVTVRFERGPDVELYAHHFEIDRTYTAVIRMTIKPTLTDDYSKLMKVMKKANCNTLFCTSHELVGLTLDQLRKIFAVEGIKIMFRSELAET